MKIRTDVQTDKTKLIVFFRRSVKASISHNTPLDNINHLVFIKGTESWNYAYVRWKFIY